MYTILYNNTTTSTEQTEQAGADLSRLIYNDSLPRFIAMYGDLGVGKTAFVRGFCSATCNRNIVRSPTFSIVNEYKTDIGIVYHFDMYRINDEDDLYSIGFYDYIDSGHVCLCEWCENIPFALPDKYIKVIIKKESCENNRHIEISLCVPDEKS